jgi:osomolarity two-component system response regulator SSK1
MPVPISIGTPPAHPASSSASNVSAHQTPSMSVLTTGKVPPLPSPGSRPNRHTWRPPFVRHPTSSPTLIGGAKGMLQTIQPLSVNPFKSKPYE